MIKKFKKIWALTLASSLFYASCFVGATDSASYRELCDLPCKKHSVEEKEKEIEDQGYTLLTPAPGCRLSEGKPCKVYYRVDEENNEDHLGDFPHVYVCVFCPKSLKVKKVEYDLPFKVDFGLGKEVRSCLLRKVSKVDLLDQNDFVTEPLIYMYRKGKYDYFAYITMIEDGMYHVDCHLREVGDAHCFPTKSIGKEFKEFVTFWMSKRVGNKPFEIRFREDNK